jgi:hypothetical protein
MVIARSAQAGKRQVDHALSSAVVLDETEIA